MASQIQRHKRYFGHLDHMPIDIQRIKKWYPWPSWRDMSFLGLLSTKGGTFHESMSQPLLSKPQFRVSAWSCLLFSISHMLWPLVISGLALTLRPLGKPEHQTPNSPHWPMNISTNWCWSFFSTISPEPFTYSTTSCSRLRHSARMWHSWTNATCLAKTTLGN